MQTNEAKEKKLVYESISIIVKSLY